MTFTFDCSEWIIYFAILAFVALALHSKETDHD